MVAVGQLVRQRSWPPIACEAYQALSAAVRGQGGIFGQVETRGVVDREAEGEAVMGAG